MKNNHKLLISKKLPPTVNKTRAFNSINGSDAESFAAQQLVAACRAEIRWASREEDNRKIDLILSFDHPWFKGERLLILVQVKSGSSFGQEKEEGRAIIKKTTIDAIKRISHSICLLWVNESNQKVFWDYIFPSVTVTQKELGKNHLLTPATLYDLASKAAHGQKIKTGGKGIILSKNKARPRWKEVKSTFKEFNSKRIVSPILGEVSFTKLGLNHMFRASRKRQFKEQSSNIIPFLDRILTQYPTKHWISNCQYYLRNNYEFRTTEYLLSYDDIKVDIEGEVPKRITANIKLIEEIGYPIEWINANNLSQKTIRDVRLKSAYYKLK